MITWRSDTFLSLYLISSSRLMEKECLAFSLVFCFWLQLIHFPHFPTNQRIITSQIITSEVSLISIYKWHFVPFLCNLDPWLKYDAEKMTFTINFLIEKLRKIQLLSQELEAKMERDLMEYKLKKALLQTFLAIEI